MSVCVFEGGWGWRGGGRGGGGRGGHLETQVQPAGIDAGLDGGVVGDHVRGDLASRPAHALQKGQGLHTRARSAMLLLRTELCCGQRG